jgi:hypothetical protein
MSPPPDEARARRLQHEDINLRINVHIERLGLVNKNQTPSGLAQFNDFMAQRLWKEIGALSQQSAKDYNSQEELVTFLASNDAPGAFAREADSLLDAWGIIWASGKYRVAAGTCHLIVANSENREE